MAFDSYEQVAASDFLKLPIGGRIYGIPPIGAKSKARLVLALDETQAAIKKAKGDLAKVREPLTPEEFQRLCLGVAYDEMYDGDVPDGALTRAAMTALVDVQRGRADAEAFWKTGITPEALAAYAAAQGKAEAATTPNATSGSTTRTRSSKPAVRKAAARSVGRRSSSSGT